jgi:hypothetical protein
MKFSTVRFAEERSEGRKDVELPVETDRPGVCGITRQGVEEYYRTSRQGIRIKKAESKNIGIPVE